MPVSTTRPDPRGQSHWLGPLLDPSSIAVVGASPRKGNIGLGVLQEIWDSRFAGPVFAVNPRHDRVGDVACLPSLGELPTPVDLAVLAVSDERLEDQLAAAIRAECRAVAIFGAAKLPGEDAPGLAGRLSDMAREAGLPICGAGAVGFCNYDTGLSITGWKSFARAREPGGVTLLSHSGSAFGAMTKHDLRAGYNLAVSIGQEISVTAANYMDYALSLPSTRVIALFLETVRTPEKFVAALERADQQNVPVVVLKAGRTARSAHMALSHSGALAGDAEIFAAVCRRHGVVEVDDIDTLMATVLLLEHERKPAAGGLASVHESGGERQMVVDLASDLGVPLASIASATVSAMAARLGPGLVAENPCDVFGNAIDFTIIRDCLAALLADPDTAIGAFFVDLHDDQPYYRTCMDACLEARATSGKPVVIVPHYSGCKDQHLVLETTRRGLPVLDGARPALLAIRKALQVRDWQAREREATGPRLATDPVRQARWRARFERPEPLGELESLAVLANYGICTPAHRRVGDRASACAAAREIGFPVALKTAEPEMLHKSEHRGVHLNLDNEPEVAAAYDDLAARLGPRVIVATQIPAGVEIALGVKHDPQFGPAVVVGAGGTLVELMRDARVLLAPAAAREARDAVDALTVSRLLDGYRGSPPADRDALIDTILRLSVLAADLGGLLREGDINPLIVGPDGAVAADALFIPAAGVPGR